MAVLGVLFWLSILIAGNRGSVINDFQDRRTDFFHPEALNVLEMTSVNNGQLARLTRHGSIVTNRRALGFGIDYFDQACHRNVGGNRTPVLKIGGSLDDVFTTRLALELEQKFALRTGDQL